MYILKIRKFEWNFKKEKENRQKHGISFKQAATAFDDPCALFSPDPNHSTDEKREWLIGKLDMGMVVVVIFTKRSGGHIYRLVSARRANHYERSIYASLQKIPFPHSSTDYP